MHALALAVVRPDDADPTAALATIPGAPRFLVRVDESTSTRIAPTGVVELTIDDDSRAAAADLVRRLSGAEVVVVLYAGEEASPELVAALTSLPGRDRPGRFVVRRAHRFLGRDVEGRPEVIAWHGAAPAETERLPGRLVALEPDITTAIARLDTAATRRARARARVDVADFVLRPGTAIVRRLWERRRDGVPGVVLSVLETYGEVVAAAKVWERVERAGGQRATPSSRPVPPGFAAMETRAGFLVVRDDVREPLVRILLAASPEFVDGEPLTRSGRGATWSIVLDGGGRAVLRWYRRGGLLRHVMRDRYFGWRPRPLLELQITAAARGRGIDVPEVLGARVDRVMGGYRGAIVTREIAGAETLGHATARRPDAAERAAIAAGVARAIRRMHDRGLHHRDLNCGNILLSRVGTDLAVHVIDLDRARLDSRVSNAARRRALRRLARSLAKVESASEVDLREDRAAFHRAYREGV